LASINPSLSSSKSTGDTVIFSAGPDDVVDLQRETVLVRPDDLAVAIKRLASLLNSHPNPGLTTRLLSPLLLPLWALSSWPDTNQDCQVQFCLPAKTLLSIYLKVSGTAEKYLTIIKNLLFEGDSLSDNSHWRYDSIKLQIQVKRIRTSPSPPLELDRLGHQAAAFVELVKGTASDVDISKVFLTLFQRAFGSGSATHEVKIKVEDEQKEDPVTRIIEVQVLQNMMANIPDKVIADSKGMLELSGHVLREYSNSQENTDSVAVALSLLNIVVTAPSFQKSAFDSDLLNTIETSLESIARANRPDVSQTANNLHLLLKYRDEVDDSSERPTALTDRQVEDRRSYNLAISYITQLDSPPPVWSEGLNLISGLIKANSPILDIQGILVMLSSLLSEEDDYMNLQVMKLFVQLAEKHPKSVVRELLDHYVDADEKATVDTRLRFGEAILKVIERLGATFAGEVAVQVAEAMLSIAGRRGYRPKTEARQAREERLRAQKQKAAERAWGGDVPDLSEVVDDAEGQTEEDRAKNDVLARILQGWESKRGSEDIRMRASALSVFAAGLETNIAGMGAVPVQASMDMCVNILTMEPEMEKAILRRAAIVLVLTLVQALADARERGQSLGFTLTDASREDVLRVLEYVAGTDNDGLVQHHARGVIERLRNWQLASMLPSVSDPPPGLAGISGLQLERPSLPSVEPGARPKIEEVE
jgi:hypothetical protein